MMIVKSRGVSADAALIHVRGLPCHVTSSLNERAPHEVKTIVRIAGGKGNAKGAGQTVQAT